MKPGPVKGFDCWRVPQSVTGTAVIDLRVGQPGKLHWVEIAGR
jgi:hypothetical protein